MRKYRISLMGALVCCLMLATAVLAAEEVQPSGIIAGQVRIDIKNNDGPVTATLAENIELTFVSVDSDGPVEVDKVEPRLRIDTVTDKDGYFFIKTANLAENGDRWQLKRIRANYQGRTITQNLSFYLSCLPKIIEGRPVIWYDYTAFYSPAAKSFTGGKATNETTAADLQLIRQHLKRQCCQ